MALFVFLKIGQNGFLEKNYVWIRNLIVCAMVFEDVIIGCINYLKF